MKKLSPPSAVPWGQDEMAGPEAEEEEGSVVGAGSEAEEEDKGAVALRRGVAAEKARWMMAGGGAAPGRRAEARRRHVRQIIMAAHLTRPPGIRACRAPGQVDWR